MLLALGAGERTPADSFGLAGYGGLAFLAASLAFVAVGAMVAARMPGNAVAWIFCVTGLTAEVGNLAYQYADYALYGASRPLPGGVAGAWLQNVALPPAFGLLGLSLLLFPHGRLLSPRWRPALWIALTGIASIAIGYALRPGPLDEPFEGVANPLGLAGSFEVMAALSGGVGWVAMAAALALGAVAMAARLRRSRGDERQQLKWITLAAGVVGVAFVANTVSFALALEGIAQLRIVIVGLALAGFPVAAGIAILRYRLYDIDVVINRALVYGVLTATLASAYLASVLLLQLALGGMTEDSSLAVAGSTLAVAGLFHPARVRIQAGVDRRFYRRRYDAALALERFGASLREEIELEPLSAELRAIVAETMQPAHVSLWVRPSERAR